MQKQPEGFLAETVDEQIEQLFYPASPTSASKVVQDLQGLYEQGDSPEQVSHSLDAIWSRLSDRISPEYQTMVSLPETSQVDLQPRVERKIMRTPFARGQHGREPLEESGMITLPVRPPSRQPGKRSVRRTLVLSTLAAIVLLSIFSWGLVAHLNIQSSSRLNSGSGSPVPTVPVTPAPQSLRDQAHQLLAQFHQEVTNWGQTHLYVDPSNGKSYELDYAYGQQGSGALLDHLIQQAKSTADYQAAITLIQNELTNLQALESDFSDHTPWNQVHSTDSSLLSHYHLETGVVIVVSLLEQSLRVYQNGQLIKAFQVTTGSYAAPSLPGSWQITQRETRVILKSSYPKDSPLWYPPTPVNYLLEYHSTGYILIDSWWRTGYGQGTNFPHHDAGSNSQAQDGSNGSVGLPTANMAWLYAHVPLHTPVVIY